MTDLKPWYAIATPHQDIRKGQLAEAVFAANLWAVAQNNAPEIYLDAETFFEKSYLTTGLKNVLSKVGAGLTGANDSGDRIISLQTSFGGGKTHMLIALWHLAKHADALRKIKTVRAALGDNIPKKSVNVAVFTNQTNDATQGRAAGDGIHTRTLWGELAYQLGGKELYQRVAANDAQRTVPQGIFTEILQRAAPCLILLDEIADYCVGASAVPVGASTLADQTISFIQQLTEAVQNVSGAVVVATLPASHLEVASSEKGAEILQRLEKRFGRMGADIKPVADDEIYQVVRRRLFENIGDAQEHAKIAAAYLAFYKQHEKEIPNDATKASYQERLVRAYPFHPELIDALYLRWGAHPDFQRTRGVLRLLASIVSDLWQRRDTNTQSQPLIQPCHIRWTLDALQSNLTRLWGASYQSVVAADVIGERANAALLDEEKGDEYAREKIVQGLAAAILLGSFGGQAERAGYSSKDLKLAVSRPSLNWNYTDGAILALEERAFYLHQASAGSLGKRYWFGTKPTLNNLIVQYRQTFAARAFDSEIVEELTRQTREMKSGSATWKVLVDPGVDLPEQKALALVVLPPNAALGDNGNRRAVEQNILLQNVLQLSTKCGGRERQFRNTLLFLLPSQRGVNRLMNALREQAALEQVQRDYASQLDPDQVEDLRGRLKTARANVQDALTGAYSNIARIEGQQVVFVSLTDAKREWGEHLNLAWKQLLEEEEWVLRKVGSVTLQRAGLIPSEGGIRLNDAIEAFLRYTDKPMIAAREAVTQGLSEACKNKLVGIGRGLRADNLQTRWIGENIALDPNEEGIWILPPFAPDAPASPPPTEFKYDTSAPKPAYEATGATQTSEPAQATSAQPAPAKQIRRIVIRGNVPVESWSDVFRSFVSPAARMNLKQLTLGIAFELETKPDAPFQPEDQAIKSMQEAAQQLGLKIEIE
ncbi:ATP-binding protein [Anaerolineae bacterium CFX7]|nr:ATP-binding protein [Anaerolineae bacterium CFX7]